MNRFNLKGKVAIITGGAGLLGRHHAAALIEINARVILIDKHQGRLISQKNYFKKENKNVDIFKTDITKEKNIKKTIGKIKRKYGRIDILINNAAIDFKPVAKKSKKNTFENLSLKKWKQELEVGLTGAFICSKLIGAEIARKRGGVILNIASDLSVIAPDQRLYSHLNSIKPATYSVIKHGIVGLTKYLASYWADKKIRVNALSPGGVYSGQDKTFVSKIKKLIPLKRMATVNEYHETIQFLCSDASSYMTGHNMIMDGGRSII